MKLIVGILIGLAIAAQAPLGWDAYQKSQQCQQSAAKKASAELGKLAAELDVVDCSVGKYYKQAWRDLLGG